MESKKMLLIGVIISIIFVIIGCVWLSVSMETLDKIAEELGVSEISIWNPPLPEYEVPGFEGNLAINIVIGILFTLFTLSVTFSVGKILKKKVDMRKVDNF
jgi:hypothetical protein